ncbi:MAG TPA: lipoyl(octanoyl) transferase LipB [Tepidisphaeraceae bacterium]|nr:lipoyl(octanoyl) transferase LipB [Tepidisphaeraceae bacterium]
MIQTMRVKDLGRCPYRDAWQMQERAHQQVMEGGEEMLLLMEHPPVITFGRRPGVGQHLLASEAYLKEMGVEVVQSDRGGDITFHGPGQIVAYPIVRLADHGLSVSGFVHSLEKIAAATLADFGVTMQADPAAIGVWADDHGTLSKVCAIGVRIRRGVSLHGLALNVMTDLRYFDLIVPCGLHGRKATSLQRILGPQCPTMESVRQSLIAHALEAFAR